MRRIKFTISTNYVGSEYSDVLEFDDDITDDELQEAWEAWVWENTEGGFSEVV